MATMDELRESVRKSLPEVDEIADKELADKVVEAYALALSAGIVIETVWQRSAL